MFWIPPAKIGRKRRLFRHAYPRTARLTAGKVVQVSTLPARRRRAVLQVPSRAFYFLPITCMEKSTISPAHTAGPWFIEMRFPKPYRYGKKEEYYILTHHGDIAVVPPVSPLSVEASRANAHLIAAAPELLAELKYVLDFLRPLIRKRASAVIDRAEGRM